MAFVFDLGSAAIVGGACGFRRLGALAGGLVGFFSGALAGGFLTGFLGGLAGGFLTGFLGGLAGLLFLVPGEAFLRAFLTGVLAFFRDFGYGLGRLPADMGLDFRFFAGRFSPVLRGFIFRRLATGA